MPDRCLVERAMRLEPELEDLDGLDVPDRAEAFPRVPPDPAVHFRNLVVREP